MFNDGLKKLIQTVVAENKDDEVMMKEDLGDIEKLQNLFIDYFNSVYKQTIKAEHNSALVAGGYMTNNEKMLLEMDSQRRSIHNDCVIKTEYINRLTVDVYGLDRFLPDTPEELDLNNLDDPNNTLASKVRHELMDYIGEYVIKKFQQGAIPAHTYQGAYLDAAIDAAKKESPTYKDKYGRPEMGYAHVTVTTDDAQL